MALEAPQFKIEFYTGQEAGNSREFFRIVKHEMTIHMAFLSCETLYAHGQHGQQLWQKFRDFYLRAEPQFQCDLYTEYLITDDRLEMSVRDQRDVKLSVTTHPDKYNDFMIGLVTAYNQDYLRENRNTPLLMQIDDPMIQKLYQFDQDDCLSSNSNQGINLMFPKSVIVPGKAIGFTIDFGVICEPLYSTGYFLMPRSSIGKTPLRQANSMGLIDSCYRGHLMVKFDNVSDQDYQINAGESLFQLAQPSLVNHWSIQLVPLCGQTERGCGGFGSTGK